MVAKQPKNKIKPVSQSRPQHLRAYSPNRYTVPKGQLISKGNFGVFNSSKKQT